MANDINIIGDKVPTEEEQEHLEELQINLEEWEEMCGTAGTFSTKLITNTYSLPYEKAVCFDLISAFFVVLGIKLVKRLILTFGSERG